MELNRSRVIVGGKALHLDDPQLIPTLRAALKSDRLHELAQAIGASSMSFQEYGLTYGPFYQVAPELIELLGHDNEQVRDLAQQHLLAMRSKIGPALEKAKDSKNPEIAQARRATSR